MSMLPPSYLPSPSYYDDLPTYSASMYGLPPSYSASARHSGTCQNYLQLKRKSDGRCVGRKSQEAIMRYGQTKAYKNLVRSRKASATRRSRSRGFY